MPKRLFGMAWRDAMSALAVFCLGAFAIVEGVSYRLGELRNIGPGTFPVIVGTLLVLSGLLIVAEGLAGSNHKDMPEAEAAPVRVLVFVCAALLAFAFLMPRFGTVPAIVACVILAANADGSLRLWQVVALAFGMAAFCTVVFVYLLNLPLELWTW